MSRPGGGIGSERYRTAARAFAHTHVSPTVRRRHFFTSMPTSLLRTLLQDLFRCLLLKEATFHDLNAAAFDCAPPAGALPRLSILRITGEGSCSYRCSLLCTAVQVWRTACWCGNCCL